MNKVHVIVNPFSARGKTGKRWTAIKEVINHYFKEFKYIFTEKPRQASSLSSSAVMGPVVSCEPTVDIRGSQAVPGRAPSHPQARPTIF